MFSPLFTFDIIPQIEDYVVNISIFVMRFSFV